MSFRTENSLKLTQIDWNNYNSSLLFSNLNLKQYPLNIIYKNTEIKKPQQVNGGLFKKIL
jgi:hypothetical protein